jgi:hypothetical protein
MPAFIMPVLITPYFRGFVYDFLILNLRKKYQTQKGMAHVEGWIYGV